MPDTNAINAMCIELAGSIFGLKPLNKNADFMRAASFKTTPALGIAVAVAIGTAIAIAKAVALAIGEIIGIAMVIEIIRSQGHVGLHILIFLFGLFVFR